MRKFYIAVITCLFYTTISSAQSTISLVTSAAGSPTTTPNGISYTKGLSADGRYVLFSSVATNLISGFVNNNTTSVDFFLKDMQLGTVQLITRSSSSAVSGSNGNNHAISMTSDGQYVAFYSSATNIVAGYGGTAFLYLFDRTAGTNSLLLNQTVGAVEFSGDGNYITILALGAVPRNVYNAGDGTYPNSAVSQIYRINRSTGVTDLVTHAPGDRNALVATHASQNFKMSEDGRYIAFEIGGVVTGWDSYTGTYPANSEATYLYDATNDTYSLLTKKADGSATINKVTNPTPSLISPDGRYTWFQHADNDFVTGDNNAKTDVFMYDRDATGAKLSRYFFDVAVFNPTESTFMHSISQNGRLITFSSTFTGYVPGDNNLRSDLFRLDRATNSVERVNQTGSAEWTLAANGSFAFDASRIDNSGNVVFDCTATNIGFTDANGGLDLFHATMSQITLAVNLTSFTGSANNDNVKLRWTAESSGSFKRYSIQHSVNGSQFTEIGYRDIVGAQSSATYDYTHARPAPGPNFYRLQMVEQDGTFKFSEAVKVSLGFTTADFRIFPNPVESVVNIFATELPTGRYNLVITDLGGKNIYSTSIQYVGGPYIKVMLPLGLSKGSYYLSLRNGVVDKHAAFIKN